MKNGEILLIVLLLVGGGAAIFLAVHAKKPTSSPTPLGSALGSATALASLSSKYANTGVREIRNGFNTVNQHTLGKVTGALASIF